MRWNEPSSLLWCIHFWFSSFCFASLFLVPTKPTLSLFIHFFGNHIQIGELRVKTLGTCVVHSTDARANFLSSTRTNKRQCNQKKKETRMKISLQIHLTIKLIALVTVILMSNHFCVATLLKVTPEKKKRKTKKQSKKKPKWTTTTTKSRFVLLRDISFETLYDRPIRNFHTQTQMTDKCNTEQIKVMK